MNYSLIDTHCHLNMMVKKEFDVLLTQEQIASAQTIIDDAKRANVNYIINVGTSLIESSNCVSLAQTYKNVYASVGIHPNDATATWQKDLTEIKKLLQKTDKVVAIGECGIDRHYPDYNLSRQQDAFKAQIELALENNLALIVHTRDAADETLAILEQYRGSGIRGVIHCFSEGSAFAKDVIDRGYYIGIGGTLTYPKNNALREICTSIDLKHIILETDAPFLPPQSMRGQQNSPKNIQLIAQFLAALRNESLEDVALKTTNNALKLFAIQKQ
jgi:TatD DNase family protein